MKKSWLYDKNVIITGASSGFGKILATTLVKKYRCKVIGIARTQSKLESLKQELGDNFSYYPFDVSDQTKWEELAKLLNQKGEIIDILINNAGILPPFSTFDKYSADEVINVMNINFFATVYAVKALENILKKSAYSAIINISSSAALCTVCGTGAYSASKSALKSFTESLILENKNRYVAIVCPGFAKTDIFRSQKKLSEKENSLLSLVCSSPEKIVRKLIKKITRKRKRIVLGFDAKLMDFFARIFPRLTPRIIGWVLKKSGISLFENVFNSQK